MTVREATILPVEVQENVALIAEGAMEAAFRSISQSLMGLGYPVTGDVSPGEVMELDDFFQRCVRMMALNNNRIAHAQEAHDADEKFLRKFGPDN